MIILEQRYGFPQAPRQMFGPGERVLGEDMGGEEVLEPEGEVGG